MVGPGHTKEIVGLSNVNSIHLNTLYNIKTVHQSLYYTTRTVHLSL